MMRVAVHLLAAMSVSVAAAAATPNDIERMQRDIELRVANHQFMGTVLVARGDRLLINQGYGFADLEWNVPNKPDTKFRIGSLTKQFTAACILLLQERGKLRVEAPLKNYLPDAPQNWDQVTLFNLLTHTSGVPDLTRLPEYRPLETSPQTPEQLIAKIRDKPLEFPPGSDWAYSNSGYLLLGSVIEKVSGESYAEFVKKNLLDPAGMKDSGYDTRSAVIRHRASGYVRSPDGLVNAPHIDMSVPFAAGGLYSTTGDLLRWERALFGGKVLSGVSLGEMTTPLFKRTYGFGVGIRTPSNGDKIVLHSGSIAGFNSNLIHGARGDLVVIVLSNLNGSAADELSNDLFRIVHGDKVVLITDRKAIHLAAVTLDRYVGDYEFSDGDVMRVWRDGDHLLTQLPAQPALKIFPQGERDFFAKVVDAQITFNNEGRPATGLVLHQNGKDHPAMRLEEAIARQRAAELAVRIRNQSPGPGTESELRRHIAEMQAGTPDYTRMSSEFADGVRSSVVSVHPLLKSLGAIQSVQFKSVAPDGADVYEVKFERGTAQWRIKLTPDGKIGTSFFKVQP